MLRKIFIALLIIGAIATYFLYDKYQAVTAPNVPAELKNEYVYIPTNSTFQEVVNSLFENKQIIDTTSFKDIASWMSYIRPSMRAGRYKLTPGWSNRELVRHLRGGKQAPINLVISKGRFPNDIAGAAAKFIEEDSATISQLFQNQNFIKEKGYTDETLMSLFIPNTYQVFWNTNAEDFFKRMVKEHTKFWLKNDRETKAKEINFTKEDVYTLASIIEQETNKNEEKARIAGVFLNRIKKGMRLEADPTAKFATGDFGARRVLNRHIQYDSPYNTYKYAGLPPGPISFASISSIDAVLNAESHDYIFYCAKVDAPGYHAFAKTLAGHNRNARAYRKWLNSQGIYK